MDCPRCGREGITSMHSCEDAEKDERIVALERKLAEAKLAWAGHLGYFASEDGWRVARVRLDGDAYHKLDELLGGE